MHEARSWEEQQLTRIIIRAAEAAASRAAPHTLCRYLVDAMDWFIAARPEPPEPVGEFEVWLIERWLKDIRSEEFQDSAQGLHLRAEWERGG